MSVKSVVRTTKMYRSAKSVLLKLFSINEDGDETVLATSSPVPKIAAATICKLFDQPFAIKPDTESLKRVFQIPGKTAWASATAPNIQAAALLASLQHDMKTAQGILIMITLSPDSHIVLSIKAGLSAVNSKAPKVRARALVVTHDERLSDQVRVEVLLTGL
ncbi:hypothetical protein [Eoetvoesiella caeni]